MVATSGTREGTALAHLMKGHFLAAALARVANAVQHFHDVDQTGVIIGESGERKTATCIGMGKFLYLTVL